MCWSSLVNPAFTRSELPITLRGMIDLLAGLGVFPDFHRNLLVFGLKAFSQDEGFGGHDWTENLGKGGRLSGFGNYWRLEFSHGTTD